MNKEKQLFELVDFAYKTVPYYREKYKTVIEKKEKSKHLKIFIPFQLNTKMKYLFYQNISQKNTLGNTSPVI